MLPEGAGIPPWASRGIIDRQKARAMGLAPHVLRAFFFDLSRAHVLEEATERSDRRWCFRF